MKGPHFTLYETEVYDQAQYRRSVVPKEVPDSHYVLINETIEKNRITHRKITEMNPGDNEGTERIIFDQEVDEEIRKTGTE